MLCMLMQAVVLLGHSTGCQDAVKYVKVSLPNAKDAAPLAGVVLQAPVSSTAFLYPEINSDIMKVFYCKLDLGLLFNTGIIKLVQLTVELCMYCKTACSKEFYMQIGCHLVFVKLVGSHSSGLCRMHCAVLILVCTSGQR